MIDQIIRFAMSAAALAGTAVIATEAGAQAKLPPTLTMTAYDTGTAGFNITVAIGKMMKEKYGADVRVLSAPAVRNRSLYVDPQRHSYRARSETAFPAIAP